MLVISSRTAGNWLGYVRRWLASAATFLRVRQWLLQGSDQLGDGASSPTGGQCCTTPPFAKARRAHAGPSDSRRVPRQTLM